MKHAHAELLHRLADDCTLKVWWFGTESREWLTSELLHVARDTKGMCHYALGDKPTSPPKKYAMVEGVRVPQTHLTVEPAMNFLCFSIDNSGGMATFHWTGETLDCRRLALCNVYRNAGDCEEASTAWAQVRKNASERAK